MREQIDILMAVYDPDEAFFSAQLDSLNCQTYENIHLIVRDDCSPTVPLSHIQHMLQKHITAFPYTLIRNESNVGSNKTFELLTEDASGEIFAYCDQDDVWMPDKLEKMAQAMRRTGVDMVYTDVAIIDENGIQTADSILELRRHCVMLDGKNLGPELLFRNFVFGCAALVDGKAAKAALPFCPHYFHDHYLTLWCGEHNGLYRYPEPLIQHRIHSSNQTGVMLGVKDKDSYAQNRIQIVIDRLDWILAHFPCSPETRKAAEEGLIWANARMDNWTSYRNTALMWRYRHLGAKVTLFEIVAARMPNWLLMFTMKLLRSNLL